MKRIFILAPFIFILLTAFTCEDEPLEGDFFVEDPLTDCEIAINNSESAFAAFSNSNESNYTSLCNSYVNSLVALITECGDPDGSIQAEIDGLGDCTNEQTASAEGTWLLTAWNGTEPIDLNNDGVESTNFLEELDCYNNETLVLNSDMSGTVMSTSYADIEIFLDPINPGEFDFNVTCIEQIENIDVSWSQSGNIVSITDPIGTTEWTLNDDTLSITIPEGFILSDPGDPTIEVIQDLTFVYTRQ